jgi:hypothetical protein
MPIYGAIGGLGISGRPIICGGVNSDTYLNRYKITKKTKKIKYWT